ncbi:MAG TPA: 3-deoxy-manno-octulosonate cytidylyltransferase [Longimicrobiales bacterium]|nr:3-deoxy-manno-octulosonate cytidylyltransferase [Longimicrobiales bacterium]
MHDGPVLGVIPARLQSQRLPRKPLQPLAGRPLIEWVWRRVSSLELFTTCVVATDAPEIAAACARFGARVELTSADHPSGTDRVAELVARPAYGGYAVVVNVQGDEPFVTEAEVAGAVAQVRAGFDVGTVATPVRSLAAWRDPAVVKVVRRDDGGALYFSRAPLPWRRDGDPDAAALGGAGYLRHIGVYAYTPAALARWVALPPHPLEATERLEQLRPLAAGLRIGVAIVGGAVRGVDTAADLARAEERLRREEEQRLQPNAET